MEPDFDFQRFYEGRFTEPKDFRWHSSGILSKAYEVVAMDYSQRRARFLKRHLTGQDNEILDFGCGAGTKLLTEYGRVTGIDYSRSSLCMAADIYSDVRQADGNELPFDNESFDYVIAIDVFGHIPLGQKDELMGEFHRILKPAGKLIFAAVETDGKDWLSRLVKTRPALYRDIFITKFGHFGYEYPTAVIERFQTNGFAVKDARKINGGLFIDPLHYLVLFKNTEYAKRIPAIRLLTMIARLSYALDNRIMRGRVVFRGITSFTFGLLDRVFAEHLLSMDHTRALAICGEKVAKVK